MVRIPTPEQINNALPTLKKIALLGAGAVALGTCGDTGLAEELVKHLHEVNPHNQHGKELLERYVSLAGVGAGLIGNFLGNHLSHVGEKLSYGINGDLEKVLQKAMAAAIPKLRDELLDYYDEKLDNDSRAAFIYLFEQLAALQVGGLELEDDDIDVIALGDNKLFQNLFSGQYGSWEEKYYQPENFPENFKLAIVYGLTILVRQDLHEQLKDEDNRRARIAYFVYLLEFNARSSQQNSGKLEHILESLKALAGLPEVVKKLSQDFTNAYELTVECLRSFDRHVREAKTEILDEIRTGRQPDLYLPGRKASRNYDYHYKAQYTNFVGRKAELEQLRQFALSDPERQFCWWMLTGAGGSGKSRTALKLCRQLQGWDFYAGFLEKISLENLALWNRWKPRYPTLIVVDYATLYLDLVKDLLVQLDHHQKEYRHPVRVLLLERDIRDDWWQRLTLPIEVRRSSYLGEEKPQPTDMLILPPLGDLRWEIIAELHRRNHKALPVDRVAILDTLHNMDFLDRPLFAFFAGMALVEGENIRGWDKEHLLENLLEREEAHQWRVTTEPLADKHLNLLVLATLTRGLSSSQLKSIQAKGYEWLPRARKEAVNEELYSRMSGLSTDQGSRIYKGLEPDLVGEYFVLRRLNQILSADAEYGNETVTELLQTAWATQPEAMLLMVFMTHVDFIQPHAGAYELLLKTPPHEDASEEVWEEWGWLWINFTSLLEGEACKFYYLIFNEIGRNYINQKKILRIKKAQALKNLAAELSGPDVLAQARSLLVEFDALRPEEFPEIALQKAQALKNLAGRLSGPDVLAQARSLLVEFDALRPEEFPEIALQKAQALKNLAAELSGPDVLAQARSLLVEFDALRPEEFPEIALQKAQALKNLAGRLSGPDVLAQARSLLVEFDALRPEEFPEIALQKAQALKNLAAELSGPDVLAQARSLLVEFDALRPEEFPEIALQKAQALTNLAGRLSGPDVLAQARSLLVEFDALRPEEFPEIALQKAQALTNLAGRLSGPDVLAQARSLLVEFDALRPEEFPEIALQKAQALTNLAAELSGPDVLAQARSLLVEFDALRPEEFPEIALQKAQALFNLAGRLSGPDVLAQARSLLVEFDALRPEEFPEIALQKAQALKNLAAELSGPDVLAQARSLLVEFDALRPEEFPEIALQKAQALFNLAGRLSGPDVLAQARSLLVEFDALRPEEFPEIALQKAQALTNLAGRLSGPDVLAQARSLLVEFDALRPEEFPEIALQKAQALKNLAGRLSGPDVLAQARSLLVEFDALRPEEFPEIALQKAQALFNLAGRLSGPDVLAQARSLLVEFDALRPEEFPEIALQKAQALKNLILELLEMNDAKSHISYYIEEMLNLATLHSKSSEIWEQLYVCFLLVPWVDARPKAHAALELLKINLFRLTQEAVAQRATSIIERCLQTITPLVQEEATREQIVPLYIEFMVLYPFIDSLQMAEYKANLTVIFFMNTYEQGQNPQADPEEIVGNLQRGYQTLQYLSQNYSESEEIQAALSEVESFIKDNFTK